MGKITSFLVIIVRPSFKLGSSILTRVSFFFLFVYLLFLIGFNSLFCLSIMFKYLFYNLVFLIDFNIYLFNLAYLKYLFNYLVMCNYIIKFIKRQID
jgi:hypothetical protein